MAVTEVGLVARAKGLSTHLLTREGLARLADARDLGTLCRSLESTGAAVEPIDEPRDIFALEHAIAHTAHRHVARLRRWQEALPGVLDVFDAHLDRQSLRVLLRGAVGGVPIHVRLQGLVPTATLPWTVLAQLARAATATDVVRRLVVAAYPHASRLLPLVKTSQPDLLTLDVELMRAFAERAVSAARDEASREFVGDIIDLGNAQNALLIAAAGRDVEPTRLFVTGGRLLSAHAFASSARAHTRGDAAAHLLTSLVTSPVATAIRGSVTDADLDRRYLVSAIERLTHRARIEPLSAAPLLRVLLLIDAQSRDLRALGWGAVFGTPPPIRCDALVTP